MAVLSVFVRAVECGAQAVDGVSLEAEPDVGVDGSGDVDAGVAEGFLVAAQAVYIVGLSDADDVTIWVTEIWRTKEHQCFMGVARGEGGHQ
ncbi:hypothetical protein ACIRU3_19710 [Streptomyces sp. NPDC101151]|uniref:hypothetical protein n=1 Tax=Streptomyces sp. NPDC101151 TaxID=3366115 RepID=UPI0037F7F1E5